MTPPALDASIVIPTHDRCDSLRGVLEALSRQTVASDRFEVVVICDGCTDGTESMCRALPTDYPLRVITQEQSGPAAARNCGVAEATGPLIIFLDDDVVPDPRLIALHLSAHQRDSTGVVIGPLLAPPGFSLEPWTQWEATMLAGQYRDIAMGKWKPTPRQFYTGNASVRRAHILEAGGFDPSYWRAEDVELAYRLQDLRLNFLFEPEARGWHYARRSLRSWLRIARAYGEADVRMYRDGRLMTLQSMAAEFKWRRKSLRRLARACVGRPGVLYPVIGLALAGATVAHWTGWPRASEGGYSLIFNLCYWQGICDRLGGRSAFWTLIRFGMPAPA